MTLDHVIRHTFHCIFETISGNNKDREGEKLGDRELRGSTLWTYSGVNGSIRGVGGREESGLEATPSGRTWACMVAEEGSCLMGRHYHQGLPEDEGHQRQRLPEEGRCLTRSRANRHRHQPAGDGGRRVVLDRGGVEDEALVTVTSSRVGRSGRVGEATTGVLAHGIQWVAARDLAEVVTCRRQRKRVWECQTGHGHAGIKSPYFCRSQQADRSYSLYLGWPSQPTKVILTFIGWLGPTEDKYISLASPKADGIYLG
jgi:hypothetical protein